METDEFLDKPNTCRIAKCNNCGRTVAIAVWEEPISKEMKKEFGKMAAAGYDITGVTLREARNQDMFHTDECRAAQITKTQKPITVGKEMEKRK